MEVFTIKAKWLGGFADQVPYALSQALNDGAEKTRKSLIEKTWPRSITMRNKNFLNAALTTKGNRATKKNLRVAIVDRLERAALQDHATGGTKKPKKSKLAIPSTQDGGPRRGAPGVVKGQRPLNLTRSYRIGDNIFQRVGRKKNSTTVLKYSLRNKSRVPKDVPFYEDFRRSMNKEVPMAFKTRLAKAMATRKPRK